MRILIVDDECPARDRLARMLAALAPQFGIGQIGQAADAVEALHMLEQHTPDVLFLDIRMPEISGLELAASLPVNPDQVAPLIVFVTAFDQYALQAFDANAIDYLLKPFDQTRLLRALQRVHERWQSRARLAPHATPARPAAVSPLPAAACGQPLRQLVISERGQTRIVRLEQVEWLETADNYVVLHGAPGAPLLRQALSALLANLEPDFIRCHRRAAVRVALIERVLALEKGDAQLLLKSGARVPCSRQYRAFVMAALLPR